MASAVTHRSSLRLLSYALLSSPALANPLEVTWSGSTYGPDGPWNAVEVDIGFNTQQTIAMYPGREYASFLLTSDYCSMNKSLPCYGSQAGLYNSAQSQLEQSGSSGAIQYAPGSDYMFGVPITGAKATSWIDNWKVGGVDVSNVSMALVSNAYVQYPGGDAYPLSVGCMGYGAPSTINQTFSNDFGPAVNASLIPGYLSAGGKIKSNSFGMHIGSVNPPIKGSMYFGGYDQNRIVGEVLTGSKSTHSALSLKDISIDVLDGQSPWNFTSLGGILAGGNSSISSGGIQVKIDGCSPYLSFPKSTCDSLASHLPIIYNKKLGLYTWNVNDVKYSQIVSSASALRFTFLAGSNTKNVSISVPFRHLNLTLQQPLVSTDTPYFPCFTGSDTYTLGRAFLQDAFIGANWNKETWWLAQAPGPNVPAASVIELGRDENTIKPSTNDWKESWSGSWKALTTSDIGSGQTITPPDNGNVLADTASTGLSTGAKAGMGIGIAVGALAIIGLAIFFWRRHKKDKSTASASAAGAGAGVGGVAAAEAGQSDKPNHSMQYHQSPQGGYYQPVKDQPGSPDMSLQSPYGSQGYQNYAQQPYGQYGYQQQTAPQELVAVGNTPSELPGSLEHYNPTLLGDHLASPANTYSSPASGYMTYDSTQSGPLQYGQNVPHH